MAQFEQDPKTLSIPVEALGPIFEEALNEYHRRWRRRQIINFSIALGACFLGAIVGALVLPLIGVTW
jgi:hypothetical protein